MPKLKTHPRLRWKKLPPGPIKLPKNVRPSERELAIFARLVRVLREPSYWLGAFIEGVLAIDAESTCRLTADSAGKILALIDARGKLDDCIAEVYPSVARCLSLVDNQDEAFVPEEEDQFRELVELWRRSHPERGPKRQQAPAGHLGREESGD